MTNNPTGFLFIKIIKLIIMLKDLFEQKKCFKLVCGAGNEDADEVEKLVTIYSLAGCNFFDVCAKEEIVDAAKRGIKNSGIHKDRYICVSVGIEGDPHIKKAEINHKLCTQCGNCVNFCKQDAIINVNNDYKINQERCIGCSQCFKTCPQKAIIMNSKIINYNEVLPKLINKGIDCIEFHAISEDEKDIEIKWKEINTLFNGLLSISLDRSLLGDEKLIKRVNEMIRIRKPYSTIIQADGIAMSGDDNEWSTTLQAVATAQLFQKANLPVYIMMSGGTNAKSVELANKCKVFPHCIAIGSYARKIIKEYLQDDILSNKELLNKAVLTAKNLVSISLGDFNYD